MMKLKNNKYKLHICSLICIMVIINCTTRNKVEITRSYIYNEYWGTQKSYGVDVYKIVLLDSSLSIKDEYFDSFELLRHKKLDSSSYFLDGPGSLNENKKIYFNKPQKGFYWTKKNNLEDKRDIIGELEINTWYLFDRLNATWEYYLYVDSIGGTYTFAINPVNY